MSVQGNSQNSLYSLIPFEEFKALLGIDDREDKTSRFCLITATFSIEQYCKRRFLKKKHTDYLTFYGDNVFTLREYPLRKIIQVKSEERKGKKDWEIINPGYYYSIPDAGVCEDLPYSLVLRPPLTELPHKTIFKVLYSAGYGVGNVHGTPGGVPPDLASACLELAAWNMNRYRGRRIGMTGNVRGSGKDGEHFEASMPENVRTLLEPYRRKTI